MGRKKVSKSVKAKNIQVLYPEEFVHTTSNKIYCRICLKYVNCDKKSSIDVHRTKSQKHIDGLKDKPTKPKPEPVVAMSKHLFRKDLTKTFLLKDIPLHKLRGPEFSALFLKYDLPNVSQSAAQSTAQELFKDQIIQIKSRLSNKPVFMIIDETKKKRNYYTGIILGNLEEPYKTYLVDCNISEKHSKASDIIQLIQDTIYSYDISRENFNLLISDAAPVMTACTSTLNLLFPSFSHITCLVHLAHNCCEKVRNHYTRVNTLISSIKASTTKNTTHRELFTTVGYPPEPVITRWGT